MPSCLFIENIIEKQRQWMPLSPLEKRLINGLTWYGDGWKEQVPVARLVKFAVALESLLMTGSTEPISETLAERVALLCGFDIQERQQLHAETKKVYTVRSKAVHGAKSQDPFEVEEVNCIAEKLCTYVLFACASLFHALIDAGVNNDNESLTDFFKLAKLGSLEEAAAKFGATLVPTPTVS